MTNGIELHAEIIRVDGVGLEILAAVLKNEHDIRILDLMIDDPGSLPHIIKKWHPEVVGFTTLCVDVPAALKLARQVKEIRPAIVTIVGGTQTYLAPEAFFKPEIDHIFQYTTRANIGQLFTLLASGTAVPIIDGIRSKQLEFAFSGNKGYNEYIVPDRQSTQVYRQHYNYFGYQPAAIMQTSLGCSKGCHFCLRWRIEGGHEVDIDLNEVIQQIKDIQEPTIMIYDNDFLNNGPRLEKFCTLLEAENISKNFICYGSVHGLLTNTKAVTQFAHNGLRAVLVGYESFKDSELADYHKKSSVDDNLEASKLLKDIKVDCWASFIFHPDWDQADFRLFRQYMRTLKPEICTFSPLTPFPNLPIYHEYKDRLLVDKEDYHFWTFGQMIIRPGKMSVRSYLFQMLLSSLYINYVNNNLGYLVNKFSLGTMFRIVMGSTKLAFFMLKMIIWGEHFYPAKRLKH
ncbi:MAG: cobalamin-dependent protein [Candidatus Marinimicrobia bacterium]|nr:cobalamin-dependent protein [Candidatus Neomarinimicrobiota bacterium]